MLKWLSTATISFALTSGIVGCVPQEKYNAKVLENSAQAEQLNALQQQEAEANAQSTAYKSQLDTLNDRLTSEEAMNTNLQSQNKDLTGQVSELDTKLKDNINSPPRIEINAASGGNALPAPLTNALTEFAAANPGLVEFDPVRGIVKFKSDVTFATGSHVLTPEARTVIDKFATILNSQAAAEYELNVAGHTDNVPVTNPRTIAAGDLNNVYLSAHRAISVYEELSTQGVSRARMAVVGYGDQRPIADNGTTEGRRANRRVEVLILPTRRGSAVTASSEGTPRVSHKSEMNKDSVEADVKPELNK